MIPKPFKRSTGAPDAVPRAAREWNPATPYIVLGLLVGSQAIQVLWLKQDQAHAKRRAEARIGLLREVIERVQRGEEVDVGKALGSGDKGREEEWAESKYLLYSICDVGVEMRSGLADIECSAEGYGE